ncbi:MAG TPA: tetratricopeptide repeat protein [Bryobacteraceae bacterium]|nr:tetratricopeptide repeat protein [Bryobacteraceae bacterium]
MKLICAVLVCALGASAEVPSFTTDGLIRLYEGWVVNDPSSITNRTLLAGAYIQKTRETTDFDYLNRASKILDGVLAEKPDYEALRLRNIVELTLHHFAKAAEHARAMTERWPGDVQSWGTLGDALLEMGEYDAARDAFARMLKLRPGLMSYNRMGFYYFVTGDAERGIAFMNSAVEAAAKFPENNAWCLLELGNMYFKTGRLQEAADAYSQAIATFPASHAAYAALGAVLAAQHRLDEAIAQYKHAQSITPMVQYAGALYDLYQLAGKTEEVRHQAELVDLAAKLDRASGFKANRTLALVYANENRNLAESLQSAQADFELRKDIYTSDVLGWALYKNQRCQEAWQAAQAALKLGAPEALIYYHAGVIAHALGKEAEARTNLEKALALNPGFDLRQAAVARQLLGQIVKESE